MSKIAQTIIVVITIIFTGCVTTYKTFTFGDGSTGYEIRCAGTSQSLQIVEIKQQRFVGVNIKN